MIKPFPITEKQKIRLEHFISENIGNDAEIIGEIDELSQEGRMPQYRAFILYEVKSKGKWVERKDQIYFEAFFTKDDVDTFEEVIC